MTDHQAPDDQWRARWARAEKRAHDAEIRAEKAEAERDRLDHVSDEQVLLINHLRAGRDAALARVAALTEALRTEHDNYSGHDQPCALLAGAEPPTLADEPCPNPDCDGKANPRGGFCSQQCGTVTRRCARCGTVGGGGTIRSAPQLGPWVVPCPECGDKGTPTSFDTPPPAVGNEPHATQTPPTQTRPTTPTPPGRP